MLKRNNIKIFFHLLYFSNAIALHTLLNEPKIPKIFLFPCLYLDSVPVIIRDSCTDLGPYKLLYFKFSK